MLRRPLVLTAVAALVASGGIASAYLAAAAATPPGLPPAGQVIMGVGQDSDTLADYKRTAMAAGAPAPGLVTLYTNLVEGGNPPPLGGMTGSVDYGTGVIDFQRTLSEFPSSGLAVGLYLSDASAGCTNQPLRALLARTDADITPAMTSQYRGDLDRMLTIFKGYQRPVYLRVGYEFDGPWNCYNADFYKAAYTFVKGRINALGASNVATVWQTAAYPVDGAAQYNYDFSNPSHLDTWYPGDDVVDYVGLSVFSTSGSTASQWGCGSRSIDPVVLQNRVLSFARAHGKPAMVAESSPQGYRTGALTKSCILNNSPQATTADAIWSEWYDPFLSWIRANSDVVRLVSYINTPWDSQALWQCAQNVPAGQPGCAQGNWGDARVQANATIQSRWIAAVKAAPFGSAGPTTTTTSRAGTTTTTTSRLATTTTTTRTTTTTTGGTNPSSGRLLLAGQSNVDGYTDLASALGTDPDGGSIYYEVKSGTWAGSVHSQYLSFLGQRGKAIQVGISWKDNPPGFTGGDETAKAARSRQVTQELANGQYSSQFDTLVNAINQYPNSTFYLRLDYEVSSYYHCTDSSCSSYKGAFARIRQYIDARKRQNNVKYVFHPVRGEFSALYPGDSVVDLLGVSVFAHELCLPIYENGYLYNGTPPQNYDTSALQCRNAYLTTDQFGNPAAAWKNWDDDGNVLLMMKFAQDHGKKMIVSESSLMNFTADGSDTSGLETDKATTWVNRLFGLVDYRGNLPNVAGTYDLSNVIQAITYIDLDLRYGFDGIQDGSFDFRPNTTWYVDARLTRYPAARQAFCNGLSANGFGVRCGTGTGTTTTTTRSTTTTSRATTTSTTSRTTTTTSSGGQSGSCAVAAKVDSAWPGGYQGSVTVTNRGPAWNGWTLTFTLPAGQTIQSLWNGTASQNGTSVTVRDAGWNAAVAPGGTVSLGYTASANGTATSAGSGFAVNGAACG